jgi:hypothetical protein
MAEMGDLITIMVKSAEGSGVRQPVAAFKRPTSSALCATGSHIPRAQTGLRTPERFAPIKPGFFVINGVNYEMFG